MPNWAAIKEEYITGDIGQRPLAKKHGVSYYTLKDRAERDNWGEERRQYREKFGYTPVAKVAPHPAPRSTPHPAPRAPQPAVEYVPGEQQRQNTSRLFGVSEALLNKIEELVPTAHKASEVKFLSEAMKNIKEIQMIKSALDEREQLARIAKLKAETKEEKKAEPIEVVFVGKTGDAAR